MNIIDFNLIFPIPLICLSFFDLRLPVTPLVYVTFLKLVVWAQTSSFTLSIFYCLKRQKDKTQVKQLRQSSPITYISKYIIEHYNILVTQIYSKRL